MSTPESKVKDKLHKFLKAYRDKGAKVKWAFKAGTMYGSDEVDLVMCLYGQYVAVELKRLDGKGVLTLRQKVFLSDVLEAGGVAVVIDSQESYDGFVKWLNVRFNEAVTAHNKAEGKYEPR
jgi:hypothetical protein